MNGALPWRRQAQPQTAHKAELGRGARPVPQGGRGKATLGNASSPSAIPCAAARPRKAFQPRPYTRAKRGAAVICQKAEQRKCRDKGTGLTPERLVLQGEGGSTHGTGLPAQLGGDNWCPMNNNISDKETGTEQPSKR